MDDSMNTERLPETETPRTADLTGWPRITLVTAVRNGAKYLEDTIDSVLYQRYPNLEYIVVDGVSTDGTIEIIKKYESNIAWWVSQPDNGLYDALNTGFARSTGEIMGWLNASDMLHVGGLAVVGNVFKSLPQVRWMTGRPTAFGGDNSTIHIGRLPRWARARYLAGANRHIQQESTYWRKDLWDEAGGRVDASRRDASDCELWTRFFRYAQLYSVDSLVGGYRMHADSILAMDRAAYDRSMEEIVLQEVASLKGEPWIHAFRRLTTIALKIPKVHGFWNRVVIPALYRVRGPDWPPVVWHYDGVWSCRGESEPKSG
jgi:glycosyltransferase involved in cell wall biosynthesis